MILHTSNITFKVLWVLAIDLLCLVLSGLDCLLSINLGDLTYTYILAIVVAIRYLDRGRCCGISDEIVVVGIL